MKKLFVIKNVKTKKYYNGDLRSNHCQVTDINKAEIYDNESIKSDAIFGSFLIEDEQFVEVQIKEKNSKSRKV